jgi:hypothetical protein
VQNVVVDRVVEAVASDVVGRLEDCCQSDLRGDHRPPGVPEAPSAERKTEPRDVDRTPDAARNPGVSEPGFLQVIDLIVIFYWFSLAAVHHGE